jgi:hypothetical protein
LRALVPAADEVSYGTSRAKRVFATVILPNKVKESVWFLKRFQGASRALDIGVPSIEGTSE